MKKLSGWMVILVLVLLWTVGPAAMVSAQAGGDVNETFDDATLPGWEHSQNVLVSDGVLRINPENFAFLQGSWLNPTLSMRLQMMPPGGVVIHFNASDQGVYRVNIMGEGENREAILEKEQNSNVTMLANTRLSNFIDGDWNTIEISFSGSQISVRVNESEVLNSSDEASLPAGAVGFLVYGENAAEIDDLIVRGSAPGDAGAPAGNEPQPAGEMAAPGQQPPATVQATSAAATAQSGSGKAGLLQDLFVSGANPLDLQTFGGNLGLAALLAFILGRVYIYWGASLSNRRKFAANFMLMSVTTTFIILVVRSSVALSLGLVGALSIVRFRAAIKEPEELAYLFLAIALGIGLGDNQRLVTILAFSVAIVVLGLARVLRKSQADVNMHLNLTSNPAAAVDPEQVMDVLKAHCSKIKLLRFDESGQGLELSFLVELRKVSNFNAARAALKSHWPEMNITFLDNKGIW